MRSRLSSDTLISIVPILAILASAVAVFFLLFPAKAQTVSPAEHAAKERKIVEDASALNRRVEELSEQIAALTWTDAPDQVEARALEIVTRVAEKNSVKILAFRPQKAASAGSIEQLPFLVSLEGSFPNVMAFARDMGTRTNRLAVANMQIASADAATDRVTATVGVVAFRPTNGSTQK